MPRTVPCLATIALAAALAACAGDDAWVDPGPASESTYTLTASGDVTRSASGPAVSLHLRNGFAQTYTVGGSTRRDSSDVTLVTLEPNGAAGHRVELGLIGRPVVGTYQVRGVTGALGARPEFYGRFVALDADGSFIDYSAATGTVTISAVAPQLRGTFSFRATSMASWPARVAPGTAVRHTPASAEFSGSFVAPQRVP